MADYRESTIFHNPRNIISNYSYKMTWQNDFVTLNPTWPSSGRPPLPARPGPSARRGWPAIFGERRMPHAWAATHVGVSHQPKNRGPIEPQAQQTCKNKKLDPVLQGAFQVLVCCSQGSAVAGGCSSLASGIGVSAAHSNRRAGEEQLWLAPPLLGALIKPAQATGDPPPKKQQQ